MYGEGGNLLRLNFVPSHKIGLGTGSWKFSTENFTFRRSNPSRKASSCLAPLREQKSPPYGGIL
jgi:hypothetical protein